MKISKQEFEKAIEIIEAYKTQVNKSLIENRICACCKTNEIKPLEGMGLSEGKIKATEQEQGCWNDGTVEKISFGYGSKYDMRSFYIAICDNCIDELEKDGLVVDVKKLRKKEIENGI